MQANAGRHNAVEGMDSVPTVKAMRLCAILSLALLFACSGARFVKPLNKKQHAASVSLGGPLIVYGQTATPIPFLTANYGYGIDSTLTGFAGVNITSALFGNAQMELGATKQIMKQRFYIPGVSITPAINVIYRNRNTKKIYPQVAVNAFWEYGKRRSYFYIGVDNWFEPTLKRKYGIEQKNHWFFCPAIGHSFASERWNFNVEVKVMAPNLSNEKLVVEYVTPFQSHGAFGVFLGYTRKF